MHKIKKAIIPVAGLGTRIYPMNKVLKKSILPIVDNDNRVKPVILKLLEELDEAQIEEIYLVIGKDDKLLYDNLFEKLDTNIYFKLDENEKEYDEKLFNIGKKVKYIIQEEPLGFGHAVYLAKEYVENQPCILVLGDTIYKSYEKRNCIEQLLDFYDEYETISIGLQEIEECDLKSYGISYGTWKDEEKTQLSIKDIVEKPSVEFAKNNLLLNNKYYGNFGEFIVTKEVFAKLEELTKTNLKDNKEYELMTAYESVVKEQEVKGLVISGKSYDAGNILSYTKIMREF